MNFLLYFLHPIIRGTVYQYHPYDPTRVYTIGADIATGRAKDNSAFSIYDDKGLEVACYKINKAIKKPLQKYEE